VRRALRIGGVLLLGGSLGACASDEGQDGSATSERTVSMRTGDDARAPASGGRERTEASVRRGARLRLLGRFDQPTYLASPPGDRQRRYVVERDGKVIQLAGGRRTVFLDVYDQVSTDGEGGLLSLAFAPDYARSGRFYLYYTDARGYPTIAQFRRGAGPRSKRIVLSVPHRRFNHKGGQIQFGPDGKLYAAFGDGGGGGDPDRNAQNLGRMLGKLIRIEPRPDGGYAVPADNPFAGARGVLGEIYAYGLRNPFRFSFDRASGALTLADVGQDAVEEVDYLRGRAGGRPPRGGVNFGWSVFEGRSRYNGGRAPGHVPPVLTHSHDDGWCSIIGGYVIRDSTLGPDLRGRYVYGDLCRPQLRVARLGAARAPARDLGLRVASLVSFGEDGRGHVYAISSNGGIYRIAPR
jgi:glucose/arabinose dehydrogenase